MSKIFFSERRKYLHGIVKIQMVLFLPTVYCLLLAVFSSCSKEKIELTFTELSSGNVDDLNSITFLTDSLGYVCGGSRYEKGDVLKTTDGGFTWHDQSNDEMQKAFYKITFLNRDTGFCSNYEGKIFRTFDGGTDWQLYQAYYWRPIRDLFMLNSKKGFACGGDGFKSGYLLNTANGGESWNTDTSLVEYRSIHFFNENTGVLAGYGVIMRTTDGGESWSYTNAKQDFFVSMCFVNDEIGYAIGYTGSILKTTDGGQSWDRLRNSNSLFQPSWLLNQIIFRDANVGYIVGNSGCFLKTEDGGDHWMQVKNAPDVDWRSISLVSNGGFLCGVGGKIYRFIE